MEKKTELALCEAPVCVGSPTEGSEDAYISLWENGLEDKLGGRAVPVPFRYRRDVKDSGKRKDLIGLKTVRYVNRKNRKNVLRAFRKGLFPITVGGDHSIAISSIAAVSETFGTKQTAVIYIDGHTDINTERTSLTGRIHGMPLAAALGLCDRALKIGKKTVNLLPENLYFLGPRSIDPGEEKIISDLGIFIKGPEEIMNDPDLSAASEIASRVSGKKVHISFDVDSIDGSEFGSTGYIMPNGLSFEKAKELIAFFLRSCNVVSMDIVEYNPHMDTDGKDREKIFEIFETINKGLPE